MTLMIECAYGAAKTARECVSSAEARKRRYHFLRKEELGGEQTHDVHVQLQLLLRGLAVDAELVAGEEHDAGQTAYACALHGVRVGALHALEP